MQHPGQDQLCLQPGLVLFQVGQVHPAPFPDGLLFLRPNKIGEIVVSMQLEVDPILRDFSRQSIHGLFLSWSVHMAELLLSVCEALCGIGFVWIVLSPF